MLDMSYMESYESLDWSMMHGQLATGLDVQLPGSDHLLPAQNGYLVESTATLYQNTKHQSGSDDFLDIALDDDWNDLGSAVVHHTSGEFDELFEVGACLPASPENVFINFNAISEQQIYSGTASADQGLHSTSAVGENARVSDQLITDVQEVVFDPDHLSEFDPDWLLSPVPILPSLEEVESVLSASPLRSCEEESLGSTEFEILPDETPVGINYLDNNIQFAGSPLAVLNINHDVLSGSGSTAGSSLQLSPNLSWGGSGALGDSLQAFSGFVGIDGNSDVGTSFESIPSPLEFDYQSSPFNDDQGYSSAGMPDRSSRISVRVEPYSVSQVKPERRERKREQNKTAALKYRQKKRAEQGSFVSECDQLEKRNSELKSRVDELTREISYLKGLISEIYSNQAE